MPRLPSRGERAPEVELLNQHGEPVELSGRRGERVLLVFIPFAFSRICTAELADLQAKVRPAALPGVRLVAVSTDSKYTLRAYAEAEGLSFDLCSDFWPHGAAARAYGVFNAESGHAERYSFAIDENGIVSSVFGSAPGEPRKVSDYTDALARLDGAA